MTARVWRSRLALALRGLAMGAVEVVPGISGGTVAFITGIYDELVDSLASFGPRSVVLLARGAWREFWQVHNLSFLAVLGAGMLVGILLFASLMRSAIGAYPSVVWGLFSGVIVMAVIRLGRTVFRRRYVTYAVAGVGLAVGVFLLEPAAAGTNRLVLFLGGMVAVSAWLLPAVSGSFILLMLGQYQVVLDAINEFHLDVLLILGSGCAVGVLLFSRLLSMALKRWRGQVLNLLTGFMAGSLLSLWPWRLGSDLLTPAAYETLSGRPPLVVATLVAAIVGASCLYRLSGEQA